MRKPLSIPTSQHDFQPTQPRGGRNLKPSSVKHRLPVLKKPTREKINAVHANILMRGVSDEKVRALDTIASLAGERPKRWQKPKYGDFEYWLARNCGWISDEELSNDYEAFEAMRARARNTSAKYKWDDIPRYETPKETDEYIPEISMKLIKDRNLTDSARRIALFVMRHVYQDNRENRCIMMTVSFIMKGLSLSRRTVQRNLTLLQKHGYMQSDVVPSTKTRMCIGLLISLLSPLFPRHHKSKWPKNRGKSGASQMTHKHKQNLIDEMYKSEDIPTFNRRGWFLACSDGICRSIMKANPIFGKPISMALG